MLPKDFPPFTTVQGCFYDWRDDGLFIETAAQKDFEASIASTKAWVYIASVQLLISRLA